MHRFYLAPEAIQQPTLSLQDREAHHALRVLRLNIGDPLEILDGQGSVYACRITHQDKHSLACRVEHQDTCPTPPCRITLCPALIKPKAFEWMIQKATELGVAQIQPVLTERSTIKAPSRFNLEKWRWLAIDAVKQCRNPWLPALNPPIPLSRALTQSPAPDLSWLASLASDAHPRETFRQFHQHHRRIPNTMTLWIGPEGDFTSQELGELQAHGAHAFTLGPLVLRAETAVVAGLAILGHELRLLQQDHPDHSAPDS